VRPGPFDVVLGDFSKNAPGALLGQLAQTGQTWTQYPVGFDGPTVVAGRIVGQANDDVYARLPLAISAGVMLETWWMRFIVNLGPTAPDQNVVSLWCSDLAGDFYGILVDDEPGGTQVSAGNQVAFELDAIDITPARNVDHEFVLQFTGGSSQIQLFMDDTLLGTATAVPSPAGARDFSVELNAGALVTLPTVPIVEFGLGVYS
jgi:hypothetical protein